jgi:hypothetical protein
MNIEEIKHFLVPVSESHIGKEYLCFRENTESTNGWYFVNFETVEMGGRHFYTNIGRIVTHVLDFSLLTTKSRAVQLLVKYTDELRDYIHESKNDLSLDDRDSKEFVDIFLNQNEL